DRLQGTTRGIDRIRGDGVRLLARDDHEAPGAIDAESPRLFFGGRAADVDELAGRRVDAEGSDRAAGALGGVQKLPVRREMQVRSPDIVAAVAGTGAGDPDPPRGSAGANRPVRRHPGTQPDSGRIPLLCIRPKAGTVSSS